MTNHKMIEVKFTGKGITPEAVRANDLADVLKSVEDMLAEVVARDHPQLKKDAITVSLVGVQRGSLGLQFAPKLPTPVIAASLVIADSLKTEIYEQLPYHSVKSLQKLSSFTRKYECEMELHTVNGATEHLATLTPTMEIETAHPLVGETTLYGEVLRVGGKDPSVMFQAIGMSHVIYCDVDRVLAQKLAHRLYTQVGLQGRAKWNARTLELEAFTIQDILDYEQHPITEAIQELSEHIGEYFTDVEDVQQYIADLRHN